MQIKTTQNLPHSPSLCEGMDTYRSQGVFRTQLPESTPAPLLQPHTRHPGGGQGQKHRGGHQEALPRPMVGRPSRCQSHRVSFPPARLGGGGMCVGCLLELGVGLAAHPCLAAPHPTAAEGWHVPTPSFWGQGGCPGQTWPLQVAWRPGWWCNKAGRHTQSSGQRAGGDPLGTQQQGPVDTHGAVCQRGKGGVLPPTVWGPLSST